MQKYDDVSRLNKEFQVDLKIIYKSADILAE